MKLSAEQHAELSKMARYFGKIEELAECMGVEVDTLVEEFKQNKTAVYTNLKENLLGIAARRQQIFRNHAGKDAEQPSIVNLTVIVNEDRF
jgi:hypothetical protein